MANKITEDPRIDPREPEYKLSQPPSTGGFFAL